MAPALLLGIYEIENFVAKRTVIIFLYNYLLLRQKISGNIVVVCIELIQTCEKFLSYSSFLMKFISCFSNSVKPLRKSYPKMQQQSLGRINNY